MSTATGNGWTIYGNYGPYRIAEDNPLTAIDHLLARLNPQHPDVDVLLDARNAIAAEQTGASA